MKKHSYRMDIRPTKIVVEETISELEHATIKTQVEFTLTMKAKKIRKKHMDKLRMSMDSILGDLKQV